MRSEFWEPPFRTLVEISSSVSIKIKSPRKGAFCFIGFLWIGHIRMKGQADLEVIGGVVTPVVIRHGIENAVA
jgi:hypothetical protein